MFQFTCWFLCLALWTPAVWSCPSQCSCFYHSLNDGSKARSVICNDPEISLVPVNFPHDTAKLRIEKTAITRIPSEVFNYMSNLEFLWMSFNSLSSLNADSFRGLSGLDELRLDGNVLSSFPWESLSDMPNLRLLDLHNNHVSSVPPNATVYMSHLTYLDLSSNNLLTLPPEVLTAWFTVGLMQGTGKSKLILGLHDNPWLCDCRLYDMVAFQKSPSSSIAFIDSRLRCSNPESLSGVYFSNTELGRCQGPRVHSAVARIRSAVGKSVLLRCGTVGAPVPSLVWSRADGKKLNGTVQQEVSKEGIVWSILSVPAVSHKDTGKYICKATNFLGSADAVISLLVTNTNQTGNLRGPKARKPNGEGKPAYQEKFMVRYPQPKVAATHTMAHMGYTGLYTDMDGYGASEAVTHEGGTNAASFTSSLVYPDKANTSSLSPNTSSFQQDPERVVRSVKVIGDTDHTVSLSWRAPTAKNTTVFSVLYAVFGEHDMRRLNVRPGKNRITIEGLVPQTKYIACVCVKGLIPKKEQCVIFSTDEAASASGTQKLINVVVITVACVIAVPLTVVVCCGALKRRCRKVLEGKSTEIQESYVTFETLPPNTTGLEGQYLTRLNREESNRLLSSRSSLDSEATTKVEGQPNEYFC